MAWFSLYLPGRRPRLACSSEHESPRTYSPIFTFLLPKDSCVRATPRKPLVLVAKHSRRLQRFNAPSDASCPRLISKFPAVSRQQMGNDGESINVQPRNHHSINPILTFLSICLGLKRFISLLIRPQLASLLLHLHARFPEEERP